MSFKLLYITALILCGHTIYAEIEIPPDINKSIDSVIQQEQQREQVRSRQSSPNVFFGRPKKKEIPLSTDKPSKNCYPIKKINIKGASLIKQKTKNIILKKYVQKCLSTNEINNLINTLGNYYLERGFITSRALITEQELNDGSLDITVIEGKVGNIVIKSGKARNELRTAFPKIKGKYLNLRDIEMGVEQMNRLQSQNMKSSLLPSNKLGVTDVQIERSLSRPVHFSLTVDNHGSKGTGKSLISGNIVWDNPLGLNDKLTFGLNGTSKQEAIKGSRGNSISYQVPYGYTLLNASYSKFKYRQPISGLNETFKSTGKSTNYKLDLDHIFHRNKNSKSKVKFGVGHKASKNFISDTLIETSSRKLTVGSLSLVHTRLFSDGSLDVGLSLHQGLKWFGAERNLGGDNAKAQFTKFTADASYSKQFMKLGESINLKSNLHFQDSNDKLYGTEQISIGGLHTVRGFAKNGLSGNSGWYLRNELSIDLPIKKSKGKVTPYIAYDVGHISKDEFGSVGGTLAGSALGFRVSGKYFNTDISVAKASTKPKGFKENEVISASISLNF